MISTPATGLVLTLLVLLAVGSKHAPSVLAASLLVLVAFLIIEFGSHERIILVAACVAGSLLVSLGGMRRRRKLVNLRMEVDRISATLTRLEAAEARRVMGPIRSDKPQSSQARAMDNNELAPDGLGKEAVPVGQVA